MKTFLLPLLFVLLSVPLGTQAAFNTEEEQPGLHQEVVLKQRDQLEEGATNQIHQQPTPSPSREGTDSTESPSEGSESDTAAAPASWLTGIGILAFLMAGIAMLFRFIKHRTGG